MLEEIELIGRDNLLERKILPCCRKEKQASFFLVGKEGSGKSAILEWAHRYGKSPKAFVSCKDTPGENLKAIAEGWGLTIQRDDKIIPVQKATKEELKKVIFSQPKGNIYVDDLERIKPSFLDLLKSYRYRYGFRVYCAGTSSAAKKHGLRSILAGLREIKIKPIEKKYRLKLASQFCQQTGSTEDPQKIVEYSAGYPKRMEAMATGVAENKSQRTKGQELDISPILLLFFGGIMGLRYIGRGMESTYLYLIGGCAIIFTLILRYLLGKVMQ